MKTRQRYIIGAAVMGGAYGLLLGQATEFPFPAGLGLGLLLGWLVGFLQASDLPE